MVTIKQILYILILLFIFSCEEKSASEDFAIEKFEIEKLKVSFPYAPRDIIQYKDGYLCRLSSYESDSIQMVFLNRNYQIDHQVNNELNQGDTTNILAVWTQGDTLFSISGIGYSDYLIRYMTHDTWIVADSGTMNKENYMHHEKNYPIFEDSEYKVSSCCRGEFGGAIFFYDKINQKTFSCPSTCISGIKKFHNSFYITSSLGGYFSSIIKIDNPRELYEIQNTNQLNDCNWYDIYPKEPVDAVINPDGYDKGYDTIVNTFDASILATFELRDYLYYLYSDTKNVYIGHAVNKKLECIDTVYNKAMWTHSVRDLRHNSNILPIRSREMNGMIILEGNKIKVIAFE